MRTFILNVPPSRAGRQALVAHGVSAWTGTSVSRLQRSGNARLVLASDVRDQFQRLAHMPHGCGRSRWLALLAHVGDRYRWRFMSIPDGHSLACGSNSTGLRYPNVKCRRRGLQKRLDVINTSAVAWSYARYVIRAVRSIFREEEKRSISLTYCCAHDGGRAHQALVPSAEPNSQQGQCSLCFSLSRYLPSLCEFCLMLAFSSPKPSSGAVT
jgi:hypothetical protein